MRGSRSEEWSSENSLRKIIPTVVQCQNGGIENGIYEEWVQSKMKAACPTARLPKDPNEE